MTIVLDVYAADSPTALTPMATIEDATEKKFSVTLNKPGAGMFALRRDSPNATEELIAQGNLVRVRFDDISIDPVAAFYMETGDFDLVSSGESGGEKLRFGGRGPMSIIDRGIMWSEAFRFGQPQPVAGVWNLYAGNHGPKAGAILQWILDELQAGGRPGEGTFGGLTFLDFDWDTDSNGETWWATPATAEFTAKVGEYVDAVVGRLLERAYPMVVEVTPDLVIRAYNTFGTDRTSTTFEADKVRLEKGVNIATELSRQVAASRKKSAALVEGDAGFYGVATHPGTYPHREVYVKAEGSDTAALDAIAEQELDRRDLEGEALRLIIPYGDSPSEGIYLPGPLGTTGHYWIGDTVTLHTGEGSHDYFESPQRIVELAIGEGPAGTPIVEAALGSTYSQSESAAISDRIEGRR